MPAPVRTAFLRGARLRCPACGVGAIGRGWFDTNDACPECAAPFEAGRGEFTGALMFGQGFASSVALGGWFVLAILLSAPAWLSWTWALVWAALVPLVFYRNWKGLWIAAMHAFDPELAKLRR